MRQTFRPLAFLALVLLLAACGGGGGDGGGGSSNGTPAVSSSSSNPTYTLSGSIGLPDTAQLDSDSADPGQPNRVSNDTLATAQSISSPVQVLGTVNRIYNGSPYAATYRSGDYYDYFTTTLTAGQTIDLSFSGNSSSDLDLYLHDASGAIVGTSNASSGTHECLKVTSAATYYIRVVAHVGYGLYNLRISAPGESSSCTNLASTTALFESGALIAKPRGRHHGEHPRRLSVPATDVLTTMGVHPRMLAAQSRMAGSGRLAAAERRAQRDFDTAVYAKTLAQSGDYEYAEPNYLMHLQAYTPSDPNYFAQRWHYEQINFPAAWDAVTSYVSSGAQRPIVAVIDSGVDTDHPEFSGQLVSGYTFYGGSATPGGDDPSTAADAPIWHGTHVTGTIVALNDNGAFGASIAPVAQVMPLRVFKPGVTGASSYDIAQAILYAAGLPNISGSVPARKADVISMSLGAEMNCPAIYQDAITQARAQGVIFVAAAGNDAHNDSGTAAAVGAPANCTGVISVGAVDALKLQTRYSNSGSNLVVMAPGGDARQSTTGTGLPDIIYSTLASFDGNGIRQPSFGGMSGTSMATPHVAAVMALMRYVNPAITPAQIDTLFALGLLTDDLYANGRDDISGYGLIDARKAVDQAQALANGTSTAPSGIVIASPSGLDFGSSLTSAALSLQRTASTSEVVTAITSSSAALSILASSVDSSTGLGTYTVSIDRNQLADGANYMQINVTTSLRSFSVQVAATRLASGTGSNASFGRLWVAVVNASNYDIVTYSAFTPGSGLYHWSLSGVPAGTYYLVAGTDADYDGYFCGDNEACGQYPAFGQTLSISGNQSNLDFAISLQGTSTGNALSGSGRVMKLKAAR